MNNTNQLQQQALHLLAQGFKQEFAKKLYEDERFTELVHELTTEFVEENIPVVREEDQCDLAFLLMETVRVTTY